MNLYGELASALEKTNPALLRRVMNGKIKQVKTEHGLAWKTIHKLDTGGHVCSTVFKGGKKFGE